MYTSSIPPGFVRKPLHNLKINVIGNENQQLTDEKSESVDHDSSLNHKSFSDSDSDSEQKIDNKSDFDESDSYMFNNSLSDTDSEQTKDNNSDVGGSETKDTCDCDSDIKTKVNSEMTLLKQKAADRLVLKPDLPSGIEPDTQSEPYEDYEVEPTSTYFKAQPTDRLVPETVLSSGTQYPDQEYKDHELHRTSPDEGPLLDIEERIYNHRQALFKKMNIRQVLPHLHSVLDESDMETIRKTSENKSYQSASELALHHISKSDKPEKWELLLKGLNASGHTSLVKLLNGEDVDTLDDEYGIVRMFAPKIRAIIRSLEMLPHLLESGVITEEDADEIRTKKTNKGENAAADLLLDRIHRKHPDWFNEFKNACENSDQSEVVKILQSGTEQRICKQRKATNYFWQEIYTEREATKPVETTLRINRSHERRCKTSPMASLNFTDSTLPKIHETEPEEISLEKEARQLQKEKEIFLEDLRKINELEKSYDENIEILSQCKRGLVRLTAKNGRYKDMKDEILPTTDAAITTKSPSSEGLNATDSAYSESDNYAPDSTVNY